MPDRQVALDRLPRRAQIDPARASSPEPYQVPAGGTAYLCAADSDGLLVSLIQSNFLSFGAGVHVPRSSSARSPFGMTRTRLPASPPPVTWQNVLTWVSAASARQSFA